MPGISSTVANSVLNAILNATAYTGPADIFVSLHTADPGGTGASEATGGSYVRQEVDFASASSASAASNAAIEFEDMPAATITHIGLWDAATSGNFLVSGALTAPVAVGAGNTLRFASGQITSALSAV